MEITVYNSALAQQGFNSNLFYDFVKWIDRGERTTRVYLNNLKQFMAYLQYEGITEPTRDTILFYRQYLTTEHEAITLDAAQGWKYRTDSNGNRIKVTCKPSTVVNYMRSVCQFFKWTAANNIYPDIAANIHAPKVRHDTHKKDALTVDEVLTIEKSITEQAAIRAQAATTARKDAEGKAQRSTEQGKRLYAMYLLAVNAGLRTIELSRANIKDLETKGGKTVMYIWGKGHTEPDQRKPLAPEVAAAVKDYIASRTDKPTSNSPLFVGTGNRSRGKRIASTTISTMLKKAMQAAGFNSERLTAHSLRHTAGTAVQEITGDLYQTQKYMRHSNPATTEIYLHNDTEKAEIKTAQALYNLYHGKPADDELQQIVTTLDPAQLERLAAMLADKKKML